MEQNRFKVKYRCIRLQVNFHHIRLMSVGPSYNITTRNPSVAKARGLQSQGVKGEAVVGYRDPLTTQDLKSSDFPVVLGRS